MLPEVESYTLDKLIPALAKGGFISEKEKMDVANKIAEYSGLSL